MQGKKAKKRYPYLWAVLYGIFLAGYTVFTLLDAFVLPKDMVYPNTAVDSAGENETVSEQEGFGQCAEETTASEASVSEKTTTARSEASIEPTAPVITDTGYESDGISIVISTKREYDTEIYIADVTIKDISYLRAGLAKGVFGRNINETTSVMAEENNAILAINGDYYGFRDSGFVMRNGYFYRDIARTEGEDEALVIYEDGHMDIVSENDENIEILTDGAVQIFSFGPGLIKKSDITVGEYSEVEQAMRSNPRTAIGEIAPFHYIFLVSDGRSEVSDGLSLWELAQVMKEIGCVTAYNLDGGGSSSMWFMGKIINNPTNGWRSGERRVSDIVYIGE